MAKSKLSKIRISKKVLRKNRGNSIHREMNLASLGGFEPTTRCLEGRAVNNKLYSA
jgi:hypothetical protein